MDIRQPTPIEYNSVSVGLFITVNRYRVGPMKIESEGHGHLNISGLAEPKY